MTVVVTVGKTVAGFGWSGGVFSRNKHYSKHKKAPISGRNVIYTHVKREMVHVGVNFKYDY
jgi:hypothetical protein